MSWYNPFSWGDRVEPLGDKVTCLYLVPPDKRDAEGKPLGLPAEARWRWVVRRDDLFLDDAGKPCWIMECNHYLPGYENAPARYPNGVAIMSGVEIAEWEGGDLKPLKSEAPETMIRARDAEALET